MITVTPKAGDCSSMLNDAIEDALGGGNPATTTRLARQGVHIAAGTYKTSAPARVLSAEGLSITCEAGVMFRPTFAGLAAWEFNGCCRCRFADFWIQAVDKEELDYGVYYHWDSAAQRSTSQCVFERFYLLGTRYKVGVQVGTPGLSNQTDETSFRDCLISGGWTPAEKTLWQKGICFGSNAWGNNYGHYASGLSESGHARGISIEASGAEIHARGIGHNGVDIWANPGAACTISIVRGECSQRLLETPIGASLNATITLRDIFWSGTELADDGIWIRHGLPGDLHLHQVQLANPKVEPRIILNGAAPQLLDFVGGSLGSHALADVVGVGPHGKFSQRGYAQTDTLGHVIACT